MAGDLQSQEILQSQSCGWQWGVQDFRLLQIRVKK